MKKESNVVSIMVDDEMIKTVLDVAGILNQMFVGKTNKWIIGALAVLDVAIIREFFSYDNVLDKEDVKDGAIEMLIAYINQLNEHGKKIERNE